MGSKFQTSQLTTCRHSSFSLSSEPPLLAVTTSITADTPAIAEMTESTSETPTLSSSAPTETLTFSHVPQDPKTLPTKTDTDTLPQLMVVMPMEDMDTEPQDTRPQDTRPQDMMPQDTEESTRLRSARRSDLTPPTTSTKQCPNCFVTW